MNKDNEQATVHKWLRAHLDEMTSSIVRVAQDQAITTKALENAQLIWEEIIFQKNHCMALGVSSNVIRQAVEIHQIRPHDEIIASLANDLPQFSIHITQVQTSSSNKAYTGKLTQNQQKIIADLIETGYEKPEFPQEFKRKHADCEALWQKMLFLTLCTHDRKLDNAIEKEWATLSQEKMPEDLAATLEAVRWHRDPKTIDKLFKFKEPNDAWPSLGEVHDYITHYFKNLLTRYSDNDLKNATQLPEALYVVKVGKLHHQTPVVYKGLNDDQEAVLHILHALFAADVTCLENKSNSIQRLQYFMSLFDNSIMKSEQDEQILNDFYAIESARSTLPTESLERYFRIFQQNVKKVIPARIERINAFKCALLNTDSFSNTNTTPCENDQILLDSALLSLTPDELLSICQRQGFLNPHRIALILQVPGHEVMHPHIKNAIKNIDVFNDVRARSPKKCWHSLAKAVGTENLIELCRYQRLGNNLALWAVNCSEDRLYFIENVLGIETLKKIIQKGGYSGSPLHSMHYLSTQICAHLNQDHISKLMNKLGVDYLKDVCTDLHDLIFVLQHLQPSEKINFLRMKGDVFLQKEVVFYGYLDNLLKHIPKQSWPDVLQMLGSRAFEIANDRLFLSSLELTKQEREVIRYAQYYTSFRPAYLRQFSDAAPLHSSIADFFRGILGYQKYLSGHFFTNGDEIAQRVIEMCNKNPPPSKTELLSHLEGRLNGIFHTSLHYSILNRPPRFNGETAMRLLFCIEKVRASMTTQPSPAPRLSRILN